MQVNGVVQQVEISTRRITKIWIMKKNQMSETSSYESDYDPSESRANDELLDSDFVIALEDVYMEDDVRNVTDEDNIHEQ